MNTPPTVSNNTYLFKGGIFLVNIDLQVDVQVVLLLWCSLNFLYVISFDCCFEGSQ